MSMGLPPPRQQRPRTHNFAAVAKFPEKAIAPVLEIQIKTGAFDLNYDGALPGPMKVGNAVNMKGGDVMD
jgi:hypothetical protein